MHIWLCVCADDFLSKNIDSDLNAKDNDTILAARLHCTTNQDVVGVLLIFSIAAVPHQS